MCITLLLYSQLWGHKVKVLLVLREATGSLKRGLDLDYGCLTTKDRNCCVIMDYTLTARSKQSLNGTIAEESRGFMSRHDSERLVQSTSLTVFYHRSPLGLSGHLVCKLFPESSLNTEKQRLVTLKQTSRR